MESLVVWGVALLVVALLLIIVEAFVPSAGLISLLASALAIAGLVCLYRFDWVWGVTGTLGMLVLAPLMFFVGLNIMPATPLGKKLLFGEKGEEQPAGPAPAEPSPLIGAEGKALTDLRPVGTVQIEGQRVQALAETSLIRAGASVRVTAVEGAQVKVRPLT